MSKTRREVKEAVEEYKQVLKTMGINVQSVILYGSYAKASQTRDSDIDLVVISADFRNMNLRERLEVLGMAAARIMKPIEAKGYTQEEVKAPLEASFLKDILETGVSI